MIKKLTYQTPTVLKEVNVLLERDFLQGSVVDNMTVVATGQEVEEIDFSTEITDNPFTFEWED
ncbi:MAG: hypothetical protein II874_01265 [Bacteroidales bacterium]|nr:hypothetical protein [Bacteroidales bacterium]